MSAKPNTSGGSYDETLHTMLARVDERVHDISRRLEKCVTKDELKPYLDKQRSFVTRHEFKPVRMIAYGLVSVFVTGVGVTLIKDVVEQKPDSAAHASERAGDAKSDRHGN